MGKKGLGRGLDALMGDLAAPEKAPGASTAKQKSDGASLPIEHLVPAEDQPRKQFAPEDLAELSASIKKRGVLQPILVRPSSKEEGLFEIVAGERRWRAAQMAGIHAVPVVIRTLTNTEAAEIALIENIQRVDLNPIEEADAYHKLIEDHGRSAGEVAAAVGKSRSHIANLLRLRVLPKKVKALVHEGLLTMGHARALLGTADPVSLSAVVIKQGLSVRQTEALAGRESDKGRNAQKNKKAKPKKATSTIKDADVRAFERMIEDALGLEVDLEHHGKSGGRLSINYLTLDQLDDICKRLSGVGV